MLNKQISVKQLLLGIIVAGFVFLGLFAGSCDSQTTASNANANTASTKWGNSPNITNYYEYLQLKQIYEARDNPNLILNAYLQSLDGSLRCFGRVKGFGVPYGTEWSPPTTGTQGSVPEPNALYPSQSTSADWVQLIDPATGKTVITFVEPNLIITAATLPCKPLNA
jgi:hypothetical protein